MFECFGMSGKSGDMRQVIGCLSAIRFPCAKLSHPRSICEAEVIHRVSDHHSNWITYAPSIHSHFDIFVFELNTDDPKMSNVTTCPYLSKI